jgi:hypothetical protein
MSIGVTIEYKSSQQHYYFTNTAIDVVAGITLLRDGLLPGMANHFYCERVDPLHSRKLRSFAEVAFQ